jgi:hypothetical protein
MPDEPVTIPVPHAIQQEALEALEATRAQGNAAGLVVLATGLGKTWLSPSFRGPEGPEESAVPRHLPEDLAPRPPGLLQGRGAGRGCGRSLRLDPDPRPGRPPGALPPRRLRHRPTPERTDGGDLLALCEENLVDRCDLVEGVKQDLLCRFRYFGVPDEVDYRTIPWRNSRFDEDELTRHVATQSRARNAYEQLQKRGGTRTLAFCVSPRHADFMADFLREQGMRAVAVHSGETSAPRAQSLDELKEGKLDVICAVDVFNEGLDLPELDTVLVLRPTESRILWLQQFGRGLRKTKDDKKLTVIDYIGNHRRFLLRPQTLFGLPPGGQEILNLLERAREGPIEIAPGCSVTYELETIGILKGRGPQALLRGVPGDPRRPPAGRRSFPRGLQPEGGPSRPRELARLRRESRRSRTRAEARSRAPPVLPGRARRHAHDEELQDVVLLGMLNKGAFSGEIAIDTLAESVAALASRNRRLVTDPGPKSIVIAESGGR